MKRTLKLCAIIALVAAIGFLATACPPPGEGGGGGGGNGSGNSGSGGTLTVNGIPSEYNGKYATFNGGTLQTVLLLGANVNISAQSIAGVQINNGSVSLPMWSSSNQQRYSGNDTIGGEIKITNSAEFTSSAIAYVEWENPLYSITFSNGSATKTWSSGVFRVPLP